MPDLAGCDAVSEPRQHGGRDAIAAGLRLGSPRGCEWSHLFTVCERTHLLTI